MNQIDQKHQFAKAFRLATEAHSGQKDRGGRPYIMHVIWVANRVDGLVPKTVALLHDIVEDTKYSTFDLVFAGFSREVVDAVDALTRAPYEPYDAYMERVAENALASYVKLADLEHNSDLSRIPNPTDKDRARAARYKIALNRLADRWLANE